MEAPSEEILTPPPESRIEIENTLESTDKGMAIIEEAVGHMDTVVLSLQSFVVVVEAPLEVVRSCR